MPQFHRIFFALRQTWSDSGAYMRVRRILFGPTISVLPSIILGTPEISATACAAKLPSIKAANITTRNFMVRFPPDPQAGCYPQLAPTHLWAIFTVMAKRDFTSKVQL